MTDSDATARVAGLLNTRRSKVRFLKEKKELRLSVVEQALQQFRAEAREEGRKSALERVRASADAEKIRYAESIAGRLVHHATALARAPATTRSGKAAAGLFGAISLYALFFGLDPLHHSVLDTFAWPFTDVENSVKKTLTEIWGDETYKVVAIKALGSLTAIVALLAKLYLMLVARHAVVRFVDDTDVRNAVEQNIAAIVSRMRAQFNTLKKTVRDRVSKLR